MTPERVEGARADRPAVRRIGKGNTAEETCRARVLGAPSYTAIGGYQDDARARRRSVIAHRPAVRASTNQTPKSWAVVPEFCAPQVVPPSVVARIVPPSPTAQP